MASSAVSLKESRFRRKLIPMASSSRGFGVKNLREHTPGWPMHRKEPMGAGAVTVWDRKREPILSSTRQSATQRAACAFGLVRFGFSTYAEQSSASFRLTMLIESFKADLQPQFVLPRWRGFFKTPVHSEKSGSGVGCEKPSLGFSLLFQACSRRVNP
jgi:hypothetical protein